MPNIACFIPAGNGGVIRWPLTKCVSPTRIGVCRPDSASSGRGIRDFLVEKNIRGVYGAPCAWLPRDRVAHARAARHFRELAKGLVEPGAARRRRRDAARGH